MEKRFQVIVFKLGKQSYAVPIDQVREVVRTPELSELPKAQDYIRGVGNIRGMILVVADLEMKYGLKSSSNDIADYILVAENEKHKIGILVHQVPATLVITESDIDRSKDVMAHSSMDETYVEGVIKSTNEIIILINVFDMMNNEEVLETMNA